MDGYEIQGPWQWVGHKKSRFSSYDFIQEPTVDQHGDQRIDVKDCQNNTGTSVPGLAVLAQRLVHQFAILGMSVRF